MPSSPASTSTEALSSAISLTTTSSSFAQLPVVDVAAEDLNSAGLAASVDVDGLIADLNVDNSEILIDILNGINITLCRPNMPFTIVNADVLAVLKALVQTSLNISINVILTVKLNANLDVVSLLSNILNDNKPNVMLPLCECNSREKADLTITRGVLACQWTLLDVYFASLVTL